MRKIMERVGTAFLRREPHPIGNNTHSTGSTLYLHGNPIAWWDNCDLCITLAGWNTATTRSRLNDLLALAGVDRRVHQVDGQPMFDGEPIDACEVIRIDGVEIIFHQMRKTT